MRERVTRLSTGVLRGMEQWLDRLPLYVMVELRGAVKSELLARELPSIADESGGYMCIAVGGLQ